MEFTLFLCLGLLRLLSSSSAETSKEINRLLEGLHGTSLVGDVNASDTNEEDDEDGSEGH